MTDDKVLDFLMNNPNKLYSARQIYEDLSGEINLTNVYRHLRRLTHYPEVRRTKRGWYYSNKNKKIISKDT